MGLLTKEQLLAKDKLKVERVDLDEEGNYVYVGEMNGRARDEFENSLREEVTDGKGEVTFKAKLDNFRSKLAVACVCDENGKRLLDEEDILTLAENMGATKLDKISTAASRINGITAKDREAMLKNSASDQTDSGSSESVEKE